MSPAIGDRTPARRGEPERGPGDAASTLPVVALVGPTASGKTAAALEIARRLPVEIISVDSAQVYVGLDIGSAKPSAAERAAVPHHLIDVADPADAYSAARFAQDARTLVHDIRARGRLPLLAGGTMLYLHALSGGLDDLPAADPLIRARLEAEARREGWPALHARLARTDPVTAARLEPRDAQRIQRALEVAEIAGEPMSALIARAQAARAAGRVDPDAVPLRLVSMEPTDRGWLHERIARRFDAMLGEGLLDEVRALRARGDLHAGLPSMRSVGYRQAWEHLEGAFDRDGLRERGIAATRQLAKRQLTWLRSMPARTVISCDAPDAGRLAVQALERALDR